MRRLGDAAVVFDPRDWQTHILPPFAAVVAEVLAELPAHEQRSADAVAAVLRAELDLDAETPELRNLLRMLRTIGLLAT